MKWIMSFVNWKRLEMMLNKLIIGFSVGVFKAPASSMSLGGLWQFFLHAHLQEKTSAKKSIVLVGRVLSARAVVPMGF